MKKSIYSISVLSFFLILMSSCYNDNEYDLYPFSATQCDSTSVSYSKTIVPIVSSSCNSCHSTARHEGNVITDTYAGLSAVALNGKLWGGVNHEQGFVAMPNGGSKLPSCELAQIKNWINQGAPNN